MSVEDSPAPRFSPADLSAIEEIRQLKARYFRFVDGKDWDGLSSLFAPDAIFDARAVMTVRAADGTWHPPLGGEEAVHRGREAVVAMIRGSIQHVLTVHHGHMAEIEIGGERDASAIWAMEDIIRNLPGRPVLAIRGYGHYHDTYRRDTEGWQIASTRVSRLLMDR